MPPNVAAMSPNAVTPSMPAKAPLAPKSAPNGEKMVTPNAMAEGKATNMAAKPPQMSPVRLEEVGVLAVVMMLSVWMSLTVLNELVKADIVHV